METSTKSADGTQSISRAASLLSVVASQRGDGARLKDLAEKTGMHVATARRILQALVNEAFLSFDRKRKVYTIGPTIFAYAVMSDSWYQHREAFLPAMDEVAERTGDTVLLSVRVGSEAVCLIRREGSFPIRIMSLDTGHRRPLGVGSGSVALFAYLPVETRHELLATQGSAYAQFGLTADDVEIAAKETRLNGYAVNEGRIIEGVYGVAVAALVDGMPVASISVAAIAPRMHQERQIEIVAIIREAMARVPGVTLPD